VSTADLPEVRKQILELVKAEYQVVPPGYSRPWTIELGAAKEWLREKPLQLRVKFNTADRSASGTFTGLWRVGVPQKTQLWQSEPMSLAPDTFHEFEIGTNLFDADGVLSISFLNLNDTALLFPLEDGMEVLYREGGFGPNFARGLGVILCWMAVLAALGLAAASFLSFPVAAFFSLSVLTLVLFSGTISNAVEEGTIVSYNQETGKKGFTPVDVIAIPMFKGFLKVMGLAKDFSPVDYLSTGRCITWSELAQAVCQIIILLGGVLGLFGIAVFTRRELATAQGTQ